MGAFKTSLGDTPESAHTQYERIVAALKNIDAESAAEFTDAVKNPLIPCPAITTTIQSLTGIEVNERTILRWRHKANGRANG